MSRIENTFAELKKADRKALIPYIMAGDPSLDATEKIVLDLEKSGADIIELGVPFSDPLADGPTIQQSAERSLKNGSSWRSGAEDSFRVTAWPSLEGAKGTSSDGFKINPIRGLPFSRRKSDQLSIQRGISSSTKSRHRLFP